MRVAIIAPFLNEAAFLPLFLDSVLEQTRPPDLLLLIDDGSSDGSGEYAQAFAARSGFARALRRPRRPPEMDRLATASVVKAFHWGVDRIGDEDWDVVVKMDADLDLAPDHIETLLAAFDADPALGIAGSYLSVLTSDGGLQRETHPREHVRGPNKFYRRECLAQIEPIPDLLGWDTIDERRARMRGWRTSSISLPNRDTIHLRPTGAHDGRLRAYRRWGLCAWGWGAHPLYVVAGAARRMADRPYAVAGLNYLWGYTEAAVKRAPQVDDETKSFGRVEEKARLRRVVGTGIGRLRPEGS